MTCIYRHVSKFCRATIFFSTFDHTIAIEITILQKTAILLSEGILVGWFPCCKSRLGLTFEGIYDTGLMLSSGSLLGVTGREHLVHMFVLDARVLLRRSHFD